MRRVLKLAIERICLLAKTQLELDGGKAETQWEKFARANETNIKLAGCLKGAVGWGKAAFVTWVAEAGKLSAVWLPTHRGDGMN